MRPGFDCTDVGCGGGGVAPLLSDDPAPGGGGGGRVIRFFPVSRTPLGGGGGTDFFGIGGIGEVGCDLLDGGGRDDGFSVGAIGRPDGELTRRTSRIPQCLHRIAVSGTCFLHAGHILVSVMVILSPYGLPIFERQAERQQPHPYRPVAWAASVRASNRCPRQLLRQPH